MMRAALTMILSLLVFYGVLCVALYLFQRSLIYFPQPRTNIKDTEVINFTVDNLNIQVTTSQQNNAGAIIYFGGNAENVSLNIPVLSSAFPDKKIYAMHYRGYGGSEGTPSEEALIKDALFLFDEIKHDHEDIMVIGRSLGSGVAIQLASQRPATRLVLITPYDSIQNIAASRFPFFPIQLLLNDKFESWKFAQKISIPTTIITAELDEVIPLKNSKNLLESFPQGVAKHIAIRDTGHNSISASPGYIDALRRDHN